MRMPYHHVSKINQLRTPMKSKSSSAEQGSPESEKSNLLLTIAKHYMRHANDGDNLQRALHYFRMLAEEEHTEAMYILGLLLKDALPTDEYREEAATWLQKAADKGYTLACYHLSDCYAKGKGVAQDMEEAIKWMTIAGEAGLDIAQRQLGIMYMEGKIVAPDYKAARDWMLKAAKQNDHHAQHNLSIIYNEGLGVKTQLSGSCIRAA